MSDNATYDPLIRLLDVSGVDYRLIDHESEGTTEIVSALRGHPSVQAAKCRSVSHAAMIFRLWP